MILYSLFGVLIMSINVFGRLFDSVKDPRQAAKVSYQLYDMLFLTICGVITGCEGWQDIEDFGNARLPWLKSLGLFEDGIPAHDTIARLISRIEPEQLQKSFIKWMRQVNTLTQGEVVAIDGKTLRSSYNRDDRKSAIHMVSAFATANGVVMGQVKTGEKSNEITAIPELLKMLDIKGCLITIDAMGCQKNIAKTIINKNADYLLAVKGNQEALYSAVKAAFGGVTSSGAAKIEQGHGRTEAREYHVSDATQLVERFPQWTGLKTIGMAINYQHDGKTESLHYRYYISSADLSTVEFGKAVRSHWDIESKLHWVLDTAMREDNCQIYRENGAENLARLRHIGKNMIKADKSRKASVRRKQRMTTMDASYLETVFLAGCNSLTE
jgi:predicted transposase YbfD/YdcC